MVTRAGGQVDVGGARTGLQVVVVVAGLEGGVSGDVERGVMVVLLGRVAVSTVNNTIMVLAQYS